MAQRSGGGRTEHLERQGLICFRVFEAIEEGAYWAERSLAPASMNRDPG